METLNFTQFCVKNGYPCDYDTMFNAQLLGGRGLDGTLSKRSVKHQDNIFDIMQSRNKEAHELFYNLVKEGKLIDADGKLTRESILKKEADFNSKQTESKISILKGHIKFIIEMKTSYLKNGKLKKGYQLTVDDYQSQIDNLTK